MKYYLAGPMTGKPLYNFPAFKEAAQRWRNLGHFVVSPHQLTDDIWMAEYGRFFDPAVDKCEWGDPIVKKMIAEDLRQVMECDAVLVLDGWEQSKGATLEVRLAKQCGMPVLRAGSDRHDFWAGQPVPDDYIDRVTLPSPFRTPELCGPDDRCLVTHSGSKVIPGTGLPANNNLSVLEEAQALVYGERQAAYGHPYDDYSRTAKMWEAILGQGVSISPGVACLMMAAVKISRECNAHKRDNMTDLAGYAACAQRCAEREQELADGR